MPDLAKPMRALRNLMPLPLALALAACAVGPDYRAPTLAEPAALARAEAELVTPRRSSASSGAASTTRC